MHHDDYKQIILNFVGKKISIGNVIGKHSEAKKVKREMRLCFQLSSIEVIHDTVDVCPLMKSIVAYLVYLLAEFI